MQTDQPLVGALIFPVGLIAIVLLGLELVTGSFAPGAACPGSSARPAAGAVVANWGWVFIGNLIGSVAYGALLAIALTNMGNDAAGRRRRAHRADRRSQDHRLRRLGLAG